MISHLAAYRADPSDRLAAELYRVARPWLYQQAGWVVSRYRHLNLANDGDDLASEGFLALLNAARRFFWRCGVCRRPFLHRRDLSAHCRVEHRVLGARALTSLRTFACTSAVNVMRRQATRSLVPDVPVEQVELTSEDDGREFSLAVREAARRLSSRAARQVPRLMDGHALQDSAVRAELRREFRDFLS